MRFVNNIKTAMLLGSLMGLCMLIGHFVAGPQGVIMGLVFGGLGNIVAFFFSDKIALMSMGAQEVSPQQAPELHAMVDRLAERAGLPKPKVCICPQDAPNAFATGRSPSKAVVAITQGMLRGFSQHEIEGVMAHEIAHVKHRDMLISTVAATMAGMISSIGYFMLWFGGGRDRESPLGAIGLLATIILAPVAAALIQMAISRQREYAADSMGGELCGDPNKLASALVRLSSVNERVPTNTNPAFHNLYIVEPLAAKGIGGLFGTHPPIEERVRRLREQARQMQNLR